MNKINEYSFHTKDDMLNKLKNEWFTEFGITGKQESYFYNKKEYNQYMKLISE